MYKVIKNNKIIDVVKTPLFVRFLKSGHIALTDRISAQGIVGSDEETVYSFAPMQDTTIQVVSIEEITLDEFNRLYDLLNSNQEICNTEAVLDILRQNKIKYLSDVCKAKITSGISVILSDKKLYRFRLTVEDQINLMMIETQLNSGAPTFLYHATDEPCQFFSKEDMTKIIKAYKQHVQYHTTYFNVAKQYINSLIDAVKIEAFTYGTRLDNIVHSEAIKQILKSGGSY